MCAEVHSDERGKFRVRLPEAGIYGVTGELEGKLVMGVRNHVRTTESLLLELKPARDVRGRVLEKTSDGTAKPIPDCKVRVLVRPDYGHEFLASELLRPMVVASTARSGGDGAFRVVVPAGEELVLGALVGGRRRYTRIGDEDTIDLTFEREALLHGRVVDAASETPVAGAKVLDGYVDNEEAAATTDAEGRFTLEGWSGYVHVVPRASSTRTVNPSRVRPSAWCRGRASPTRNGDSDWSRFEG